MEKVLVEVSYTGKNFSAHLPSLPGVVSVGDNLSELKDNIREAVDFHLEGMKEDGEDIPDMFRSDYEFEFHLSVEALLHELDGVLTKAAISRITGVNERQLWHYSAGLRKPRPAQRKRIEEGLHKLASTLMSVSL